VFVRVLLTPVAGAAALAAVLAVLVAGCTSDSGGKKSDAASEVTLQAVKIKDFEKARESHRGKVVLVDVWGEF